MLEQQLKLLVSGAEVCLLSLYFTRMSALFFYRRIFQVNSRAFKISLWIGVVLNTLWILTFFIFTLVGCRPLQKFWKPRIPGECVSIVPMSLGNNVTSVFMDLYILILPMPKILRLNLKWGRKVMLVFVFFLGYW